MMTESRNYTHGKSFGECFVFFSCHILGLQQW